MAIHLVPEQKTSLDSGAIANSRELRSLLPSIIDIRYGLLDKLRRLKVLTAEQIEVIFSKPIYHG